VGLDGEGGLLESLASMMWCPSSAIQADEVRFMSSTLSPAIATLPYPWGRSLAYDPICDFPAVISA
jgi:hypothetical protein